MILILLFLIPRYNYTIDHVDIIEINHLYDKTTGELQLDQYIFWDIRQNVWEECIDWRLCNKRVIFPGEGKKSDGDFAAPWPRRKGNVWVLIFYDNQNGQNKIRKIIGTSFRETWTLVDPEVSDRSWLKPENRKGLSK